MKNQYVLVLSIFAVVLISGCTGVGGIFGSDVLSITENVVQEDPKDVMIIRDAQIIPSSPVLPDQETTLTFIVENKDDTQKARNVAIDLYNAPSFKSGKPPYALCNTAGCFPESGECSKTKTCEILPGAQNQVEIKLKAPSESEIAGIKTDTSLDYKVNYDYESALVYTVPVVDLDEIVKRQRTNEKTIVEFFKSHSSGPLRIDTELIGAPYILDTQPATITFKINNIGSGIVKDSKIERSSGIPNDREVDRGMIIIFPAGLTPQSSSGFTCAHGGDKTICHNTDIIGLYKDETMTSIRFKVTPDKLNDVPLRSYTIIAQVGYNYELRNSVKVTVNSFQNVG